jgi:hypothetical protein
MFETSLTQRKSISSLILAYHLALEKIDQGIDTLAEAERLMKEAYGQRYSDFSPIERFYNPENLKKEARAKYRKSAWRNILKLLELEKVMSSKRKADIDKRFEDDQLIPELEEATVYSIVQSLLANSSEFVHEMIVEAYDTLMPASRLSGQKYVTNQKNGMNELGKKVILSWMVERDYSGNFRVRIGGYTEERLMVVDKTFHVLDGQPFASQISYRGPLCDAINTSGSSGKGETEYFKFECYQNGNLHLGFKRMDLVKRINQTANDGTKLKSGW